MENTIKVFTPKEEQHEQSPNETIIDFVPDDRYWVDDYKNIILEAIPAVVALVLFDKLFKK
jgi:hypothetical protein